MGTYRLRLETGHLMDLVDTCYVPTISRNLISLSRIDELGYCISFGSGKLSIFYDSIKVGSGILCDGLYRINLDLEFAKTLMTLQSNVGLNIVSIMKDLPYCSIDDWGISPRKELKD